ncbi:HTH-type transcriptional activator CmpR [Poriferisphaera corsica]|uniref:HTH-type transcriptional activator CmpR n=1 Tax=Poriferisphaera corsica TaxID=2528020 RepID=A0A517YQS8_9BACT|nr:LysR family transcriptional regulator [Poriferisphaera corsica]QDU32568.1 HTH-type transcriptional activator CmpR [Poriferisphaera corsica]
MNQDVTIRQLEVFVVIAREGNLTRAAELLGMTQSAASMSLKQFENLLGYPVFSRVGRGLVLNDLGRQLLPKSQQILGQLEAMVSEVYDQEHVPTGHVVIGCSTTIGNYLLPSYLKEFLDEHDGITVSVHVGNTNEIARMVRRGDVDLGLIEGELVVHDLYEEDWMRDHLVVIVSPNHRLAGKKRVSQAMLSRESWVMREMGSGTRSTVSQAAARQGLQMGQVVEIGHTEAIKRAVETGLGLSCLSELAVKRELEDGRLAALPMDMGVDRWFRMICVDGASVTPLVGYVMQWMRDLAMELGEKRV